MMDSVDKLLAIIISVVALVVAIVTVSYNHYTTAKMIACYEAAKVNTNLKCEETKK